MNGQVGPKSKDRVVVTDGKEDIDTVWEAT